MTYEKGLGNPALVSTLTLPQVKSARISLLAVFELFKLRLSWAVLAATWITYYIAPGLFSWAHFLLSAFLILALVSGANALNMFLEQISDAKMERTMGRPLPSGRLEAGTVFAIGISLSLSSIMAIAVYINYLTALIATISFILYVWVYTPLKAKTHLALLIGAVPGAMPAVMGWTAKSNSLEPSVWIFFAILFLWQIPHFHAITLFRASEYANAGLKVLPNITGVRNTQFTMLRYTTLLLMSSALIYLVGIAGVFYLSVSLLLGCGLLLYIGFALVKQNNPELWGRRFFLATLFYLPLIFLALFLDLNL